MNYVPRGPKKPVNMTLSEDLVREARRFTNNLSETVEALLAEHVAAESGKREDKERRTENTILKSQVQSRPPRCELRER